MIVLGLGTNVGNRLSNIRKAYQYLSQVRQIQIEAVSPIYESDALLPEDSEGNWDQPYLNLAILCSTQLEPEVLMHQTKIIEKMMGRESGYKRWSPREIDIDLLAWNDMVIETDRLKLPHKGLIERPFALFPLADVWPEWIYPVTDQYHGKSARELVERWGSRFDGNAPLHTRQIANRIDAPRLVGVLNVTPDSFSDGGKFTSIDAALEQFQQLHSSGAEIVDIGAQATNPKAKTISADEEWQRLEPILKAINDTWSNKANRPLISVDTCHPTTANHALQLGIDWLNDVSGCDSAVMQRVIRDHDAKVVIMHHKSIPEVDGDWLSDRENILETVFHWGQQRIETLVEQGISQDRIIFDIGIGFGKAHEQNIHLLKHINYFKALGVEMLVGHSRKRMLGHLMNVPVSDRDFETGLISLHLAKHGVDYIRVHDVNKSARAFKLSAMLEPFPVNNRALHEQKEKTLSELEAS